MGNGSDHAQVALVYDHELTETERQRVEVYLMQKWGILPNPEEVTMPQAANPLSGALALTGDATLDLNGMAQDVKSLALDADGETAWPVLSVLNAAGGIDLSEGTLTLAGENASAWQTIVGVSGGVAEGQFKSVVAKDGVTARNKGTAVKAGTVPGMILIFR